MSEAWKTHTTAAGQRMKTKMQKQDQKVDRTLLNTSCIRIFFEYNPSRFAKWR